jgi:hypothetical protein
MGVQTDLRAGDGLRNCDRCGSLVYVDQQNVSWNIQFNIFSPGAYNIVDQHNDSEVG